MPDNNLEKDPKTSNTKKILYVIVFICSFLLSYWGTKTLIGLNQPKKHKYNKETMQIIKDASFVKGFELINTSELRAFCSDTGYIPNDFIKKFENQFSKTITNADKIIDKNFPPKEFQKLIEEKISKEGHDILESEYKRLYNQQKISKKEFCQMFDKQKDKVVADKVQIFKQNKPNMFLD